MVHDNTSRALEPFAAALIRRKARQLVGRYGFTREDQGDIEQDLVLHYWKRRHHFSPGRGHPHAFLAVVIERCIASLIQKRLRFLRRRPYSLNVSVSLDGGLTELAQLVGPREQGNRVERSPRNEQELLDLALDVHQFVATLTDVERQLVGLLLEDSISGAARKLQLPRSTFRDRVLRLRRRFAEAGFQDSFPHRPPVCPRRR